MSELSALDLSLGETDNQDEIVSSTPKKKKGKDGKAQLVCPYCDRTYVVKFYFDKHVESHLSQANAASSSSQFKLPAVPALPAPSAPKTKNKVVITGTAKQVMKKKAYTCTYCLKGFASNAYFVVHVRYHLLEECSSRFPDRQMIKNNVEDVSSKALTQVTNDPCYGETTADFRELLGTVASQASSDEWKNFTEEICEKLIHCIKTMKVILPSALMNGLLTSQENLLSDFDARDTLLDKLNLQSQFSDDVCAQFFLKYVLYFTTQLFHFISTTFRTNCPRPGVSYQVIPEPNEESRQVVYYIAGSVVRRYLKIARRFPSNNTWQEVASVLRSKVLVDKPTECIEKDAEWTSDVDRGGLLYISSQCQSFFVNITKVIFSHEAPDGSLNYETVVESVCNSNLSVEWDRIISDSLNQTVSLKLLNDIVVRLCRTCGQGFARRRLNCIRSRPIASMTVRHLAASRKNR